MFPTCLQRLPACLFLGIGLLLLPARSEAQVTVLIGGNATSNVVSALFQLDISYTDTGGVVNPDPANYGLGAGDYIILSNNGGSGFNFDYTNFLNSGGHLIVIGGSTINDYPTWVSQYFNITDNGSGWHTDGLWHSLNANNGLPLDFNFEDVGATYHMLAIAATPNTFLYGINDEGQYVSALRFFDNGGTFNFMALNLGPFGTANDVSGFILPWLSVSLDPAILIPEPSTYLLLATGLLALLFGRRRT